MPQEHADQVRAALQAIVQDPEYGAAALSSPRLISNLLRDYLPEAPLEKNLLIAAAEEGVADQLRDNAVPGADISVVMRSIETSFRNRRGLTEDASSWVVGELSIALGLSSGEDATTRADPEGIVSPPAGTVTASAGAAMPLLSPAEGGAVAAPAVGATVPRPTPASATSARSSPGMVGDPSRRLLVVVLGMLGVLFLVLGMTYFADPGALPLVFFGPHEAIRRPRLARGTVALIAGVLALAGAWQASRSRFSLANASSRRLLVVVFGVLGLLFLVLGVIYFADPGALPLVFFRPHEAIRKPHPIRGGVALGVGVLALAGSAWLTLRSKKVKKMMS